MTTPIPPAAAYTVPWTAGRRSCSACGEWTGTKHKPAMLAIVNVVVEGWPRRGVWGSFKQGSVLCAYHGIQGDSDASE